MNDNDNLPANDSAEKRTIRLGDKDIVLGAVHSYTYPEVLKPEDMRQIDAYLTSAAIFHKWLSEDAPDHVRGNESVMWRKFCAMLADIAKLNNISDPVSLSMCYSWLTNDDRLNRYPFDRLGMIQYYNDVFWYTVGISATEHVGNQLVNKQGKFIKRVRNYVYKTYSIDLPDALWEFLGGIVKGYVCDPAKTVYWRITDNLLWTDGSFADSGSCMMSRGGGYRDGLRMLVASGAYAIQFFSSEVPKFRWDGNRKQYTNGIGRAWLLVDNNGFSILNGYGTDVLSAYNGNSKCTDKIADVISDYVGIKSETKPFNPIPDGVMYVNDDRTCRYFSTNGEVPNQVTYRFKDYRDAYIDADPPEDTWECENCGRVLYEDEVNHHDGYDYCEQCFHRLFTYCDRCDEYRDSDEFVEIYNGDFVCDVCAQDFTPCWHCDTRFAEDMLIEVRTPDDGDVLICEDCWESNGYVECRSCGEYHASNMVEIDGGMYCSVCSKEKHNNSQDD